MTCSVDGLPGLRIQLNQALGSSPTTTLELAAKGLDDRVGDRGLLIDDAQYLVAMDFYIGVDQDIEKACSLVKEACFTSRFCFLDHPVPVLAKQVISQDYVAYQLKARPYVLDVKYEKAFETDVHIRVQKAFREHGIQPPAVLHRQTASS